MTMFGLLASSVSPSLSCLVRLPFWLQGILAFKRFILNTLLNTSRVFFGGKCTYCPLIKKASEVQCKITHKITKITKGPKHITCELSDIIYLITCKKCVKIMVTSLKKIRLTRGLRQGCPISALLFIIVVEILAIKIRSNDAISGLSIQDTTFKISQYADDLTLILSDLQSVSSSINIIKQFSKVAGPKVNLDKTEGLLIGNLKNSNIEEYMGISITNRLTKVLGIYIGNTQIQCKELNWNGKLNKIQNILNLWIKRNLTIFGKTVVVNTLCISKLIYNFLLIPVPEYVIKKLENMIINFLFKSRQRLNRKCLINTVENSGINLVDIRCKISALKASWICRWSNEAPWVALGNYFLQEAWLSYYSCRPKPEIQDLSPYNFLTSIIWGNKYFQFKGKCLYFKNWINAGIVYVKDLFN